MWRHDASYVMKEMAAAVCVALRSQIVSLTAYNYAGLHDSLLRRQCFTHSNYTAPVRGDLYASMLQMTGKPISRVHIGHHHFFSSSCLVIPSHST
jgi:hypothetical protein